MKKLIGIIGLLIIIFLSPVYEDNIRGRTQIEHLYPILVAAIDKNSDKEIEYLITAVSPTTEEEAEKPDSIMSAVGKTAFEANRNIGLYAENDIYWGHTKYILIGEEAARENVYKYLDFFMRDNEPRMTLMPLIVRGKSGQELIESLYGQNIDITKSIATVIDNFSLMSYASAMKFADYIETSYEYQNGFLPYVELAVESDELIIEESTENVEDFEEESSNAKGHKHVVYSPGYAIIKDQKVVDFLPLEKGRGLNWFMDKVVSGVIVVEHQGVSYNLEITKAGSELDIKVDGEEVQAEIEAHVCTNITEISDANIRVDNDLLTILEGKLKEKVQKEIGQTLEIAQKHEVDILGFGDKFYHKYPVKWQQKYKDRWEEMFPNLYVKISIDPSIERSSRFYESIFTKEED